MHLLTADGRRHQLLVEMVAANGSHYYEEYDDFSIGPAREFQLHIGNYRGTAGKLLISTRFCTVKIVSVGTLYSLIQCMQNPESFAREGATFTTFFFCFLFDEGWEDPNTL